MSELHVTLGYGKTGVVEMDAFTRIMRGQFYDTEEVRMLRNDVYEYCGVAPDSSSIYDPVWTCLRQSRDVYGKVARWQIRFNVVWNDVITGWNN